MTARRQLPMGSMQADEFGFVQFFAQKPRVDSALKIWSGRDALERELVTQTLRALGVTPDEAVWLEAVKEVAPRGRPPESAHGCEL